MSRRLTIIGVVHLPSLRTIAMKGRIDELLDYVEREVKVLEEAGLTES